jgi:hypothetical protein
MKKYFLSALSLILGGLLVLSGGCGDKSTESNNLSQAEMDLVDGLMSESVQSLSFDALKIGLDLTDSVAAMGGVGKPLFTLHKTSSELVHFSDLAYSYDNFWHIFELIGKITFTDGGGTDSLVISGIDSIRFQNSGTPVQYPDELLTDEVNFRQHFSFDAYGALGSSLEIVDHSSLDITGESFELDIFTLNGHSNDTLNMIFESVGENPVSCNISLAAEQDLENVVIEEDLDCPVGGTAEMTAVLDMECSDPENSFALAGTWTATWTFTSDGMVHVVISSGSNHWEDTQACNGT